MIGSIVFFDKIVNSRWQFGVGSVAQVGANTCTVKEWLPQGSADSAVIGMELDDAKKCVREAQNRFALARSGSSQQNSMSPEVSKRVMKCMAEVSEARERLRRLEADKALIDQGDQEKLRARVYAPGTEVIVLCMSAVIRPLSGGRKDCAYVSSAEMEAMEKDAAVRRYKLQEDLLRAQDEHATASAELLSLRAYMQELEQRVELEFDYVASAVQRAPLGARSGNSALSGSGAPAPQDEVSRLRQQVKELEDYDSRWSWSSSAPTVTTPHTHAFQWSGAKALLQHRPEETKQVVSAELAYCCRVPLPCVTDVTLTCQEDKLRAAFKVEHPVTVTTAEVDKHVASHPFHSLHLLYDDALGKKRGLDHAVAEVSRALGIPAGKYEGLYFDEFVGQLPDSATLNDKDAYESEIGDLLMVLDRLHNENRSLQYALDKSAADFKKQTAASQKEKEALTNEAARLRDIVAKIKDLADQQQKELEYHRLQHEKADNARFQRNLASPQEAAAEPVYAVTIDEYNEAKERTREAEEALKQEQTENQELLARIQQQEEAAAAAAAQLQEMQDSLAEQRAANDALQSENNALKGEIAEQQAENEKLRSENDALRAENEALRAELAEEKAVNEALQAESEALKADLEDQRASNETLKTENEALKSDLAREQATNEALQNENETLKAELADHEAAIEVLQGENEALKQQIDAQTEEGKQRDLTASEQQAANEALQGENEALKQDLAEQQAANEALKADVAQLEDEVGAFREKRNDALKAREADGDLPAEQRSVAPDVAAKTALTPDQIAAEPLYCATLDELNAAREEIEALKGQLDEHVEQGKQRDLTASEQQAANEALQGENEALKQDLAEQQAANEALKADVAQLEDEVGAFREKRNDALKAREADGDLPAEQRSVAPDVAAKTALTPDQIAAEPLYCATLDELNAAREENEALKGQLDEQAEQSRQMNLTADEQQAANEALQGENEALKQDLAEQQAANQALEAANEALKTDVAQLEDEVGAFREKRNDALKAREADGDLPAEQRSVAPDVAAKTALTPDQIAAEPLYCATLDELNAAREENEGLRGDLAEQQAANETLQGENEALKADVAQLEDEVGAFREKRNDALKAREADGDLPAEQRSVAPDVAAKTALTPDQIAAEPLYCATLDELNAAREEIEALKGQLDEHVEQGKQRDLTASEQQAANEALQGENEALKQDLAEQQAANEALKADVAQLEDEVGAFREKRNDALKAREADGDLPAEQRSVAPDVAAKTALTPDQIAAEPLYCATLDELNAAREENEALKGQLDEQAEQSRQMNLTAGEQQAANEALQGENEALKQDLAEQQAANQALEAANEALKADVAQLEDEVGAFREKRNDALRAREADGDLPAEQRSVAPDVAAKTALTPDQIAAEPLYCATLDELNAAREEIEALKGQLDEQAEQSRQMNLTAGEQQAANEALQGENEALKQDLAEQQAANEALKADVAQLEDEVGAFREKRNDALKAREADGDLPAEQRSVAPDVAAKTALTPDQIAAEPLYCATLDELNAAREENEGLRGDLAEQQAANEALQGENEALKADVAQLEDEVGAFREKRNDALKAREADGDLPAEQRSVAPDVAAKTALTPDQIAAEPLYCATLDELNAAREENEGLRGDLAEQQAANETLQGENEALKADVAQLEDEVGAFREKRNDALKAREADGDLPAEQRSVAPDVAAKTALTPDQIAAEPLYCATLDELNAAREEIEALKGQLDEQAEQSRQMNLTAGEQQAANEALQGENEALKQDLAEQQAANEALKADVAQLEDEVGAFREKRNDALKAREADGDLPAEQRSVAPDVAAKTALTPEQIAAEPLYCATLDELNAAREEIEALKGQLDEHVEQGKQRDLTASEQQAANEALQGENEALKQDLAEQQATNEALQGEVEALKAELDKQRAANESLQSENDALKAALAEEEASNEALRADLAEQQAANDALNAENEALKEELNAQTQEAKQRDLDAGEQQAANESLQGENEALKGDLAEQQADNESLRNELADMQAENEALKQDLAQLEDEVGAFREKRNDALKAREADGDLPAEQRSVAPDVAAKTALTPDQIAAEPLYCATLDELNAAREENEGLRGDLAEQQAANETLQGENEALKAELADHEAAIEVLQGENEALKQQIDAQTEEGKQRDLTASEQQAANEALQGENEALKADVAQLEDEVGAFREKRNDALKAREADGDLPAEQRSVAPDVAAKTALTPEQIAAEPLYCATLDELNAAREENDALLLENSKLTEERNALQSLKDQMEKLLGERDVEIGAMKEKIRLSDKSKPQITTAHTKVFDGKEWDIVLSRHPEALKEAFMLDSTNACRVQRDDIGEVRFIIGSLHCFFNVTHDKDVSEDVISDLIEKDSFPHVMELYARRHGPATGLDAANEMIHTLQDEKEALKLELAEQRAANEALEAENEALQAELAEKEAVIDALQRENEALKDQIAAQAEQGKQRDLDAGEQQAANESLQGENEALKGDLAEQQADNESLRNELADMQAENEALKQDLAQLEDEVGAFREKRNDALKAREADGDLPAEQRSVAPDVAAKTALTPDQIAAEPLYCATLDELNAAREENEGLRGDLAEQQAANEALQGENEALKADVAQLEDEVGAFREKRNDALKAREADGDLPAEQRSVAPDVAAKTALTPEQIAAEPLYCATLDELNAAREEIEALKGQLDEHVEQGKQRDLTASEQQAANEALQGENDALKQDLAKQHATAEAMQHENEALRAALAGEKAANEALEREKEALQAELAEKEAVIDALQRENEALKDQIAAQAEQGKQRDLDAGEQQAANRALQAELDALKAELAGEKATTEALRAENEALNTALAQKDDALNALQSENETLKTNLAQQQEENKALKGANDSLNADLAAQKTAVQVLQDERENLKADLAELQAEVETLKGENDGIRNELEEVLAENSALQEQLRAQEKEAKLLGASADEQSSALAVAQSALAKQQAANEALKGENDALRADLAEQQAANEALQDENDALRADLVEQRAAYDALQGELEEVTRSEDLLKKRLREALVSLGGDGDQAAAMEQLEKLVDSLGAARQGEKAALEHIAELEAELERQRDLFSQEEERLTKDAAASRAEAARLQQELDKMTDKLDELMRMFNDADASNEAGMSKLEGFAEVLGAARDAQRDAVAQLAAKEDELDALRRELAAAKAREEDFANIADEHERLKKEMLITEKETDDAKQEANRLKAALRDAEDRANQARKELAEVQGDLEMLKGRCDDLVDELKDKTAQYNQVIQDLDAIAKKQNREGEKELLQQLAARDQELFELQEARKGESDEHDKQVALLQDQVNRLRDQLEKDSASQDNMYKEESRLREALAAAEAELKLKNDELNEMREGMDMLIEDHEDEMRELEADLEARSREASDALERLEEMTAMLQEARESDLSGIQRRTESDAEIFRLQRENDRLRTQQAAVDGGDDKETLLTQFAEVETERRMLEETLAETEAKVAMLQETYDKAERSWKDKENRRDIATERLQRCLKKAMDALAQGGSGSKELAKNIQNELLKVNQ